MSFTDLRDNNKLLFVLFGISPDFEKYADNEIVVRNMILIHGGAQKSFNQQYYTELDHGRICSTHGHTETKQNVCGNSIVMQSQDQYCDATENKHSYMPIHLDPKDIVVLESDAHFAGCLAKTLRVSIPFVDRFVRYSKQLSQPHPSRLCNACIKSLPNLSKSRPIGVISKVSQCQPTASNETELKCKTDSTLLKANTEGSVCEKSSCTNGNKLMVHRRCNASKSSRRNHRCKPLLYKSRHHQWVVTQREILASRVMMLLNQSHDEGICDDKNVMIDTHSTVSTSSEMIILLLHPSKSLPLDLSWFYRIEKLIIKAAMLDDALNWLSTLGGAYSALGDHFTHHAENAERISYTQLRIAVEMDCEPVVARCYLYIALSSMQRGQLKTAKRIIRSQYRRAQNMVVVDTRLLAMCQGMWSRLRYLYNQSHHSKHHTLTNGHSTTKLSNGVMPNKNVTVV